MKKLFLTVLYLVIVNLPFTFFLQGCSDDIKTASDGEEEVDLTLTDPTLLQVGDRLDFKYKTWLSEEQSPAHVYIYGVYNNGCLAKDIEFTATSSNNYVDSWFETEYLANGCNLDNKQYSIQLVVDDDGVTRSSEIRYFSIGNPGSVSLNELFVSRAKDLLTGCPNFFEPPNFSNNFVATNKNTSGGVSWSSTAVNKRVDFTSAGENETKAHYIDRINNASFSFQLNWYSYACGFSTGDFTKGFPYPPQLEEPGWSYFGGNSFITCSAGFVCYAFVWEAAKQAGYTLPIDFRGGTNWKSCV